MCPPHHDHAEDQRVRAAMPSNSHMELSLACPPIGGTANGSHKGNGGATKEQTRTTISSTQNKWPTVKGEWINGMTVESKLLLAVGLKLFFLIRAPTHAITRRCPKNAIGSAVVALRCCSAT
jgi:hypothetical protein